MRKVVTFVAFVDDLTGEEFAEGDGETLTFVWGGRTYEVDLIKANAERFREAMTPWLAVSRPAATDMSSPPSARRSSGGGTGRPGQPRRKKAEIMAIREWGRAQGYEVPEMGQGRTPEHVVRAYDEAHRQG